MAMHEFPNDEENQQRDIFYHESQPGRSCSSRIILLAIFGTTGPVRECLHMSNHSTVDWKSFCSEVCEHWLENRDPIGGENMAVEIGETLIIRRKLERGGRMFSQVWLFGGIERVSKRRFVVGLTGPNDRKDEQTLLPLNKDFVLPGSIIYSDWWKAYENLSSLYVHCIIMTQ